MLPYCIFPCNVLWHCLFQILPLSKSISKGRVTARDSRTAVVLKKTVVFSTIYKSNKDIPFTLNHTWMQLPHYSRHWYPHRPDSLKPKGRCAGPMASSRLEMPGPATGTRPLSQRQHPRLSQLTCGSLQARQDFGILCRGIIWMNTWSRCLWLLTNFGVFF